VFFRELIRDGKHYPEELEPWPALEVDHLEIVKEMDRHLTRLPRLHLLVLGIMNFATAGRARYLNAYLAKDGTPDRRLQYLSFQ
jgi:hypothetical protein